MNNPIRVLQVGMSQYYGGTESFIMNQYRKINREKIQFDFLNVYNGPLACEEEIKQLGGQIYSLDMSRRKGLKKYRKNLDNFFKENASKFNVIHCNFQSLINIDLLKYAKKYNIPVRIAHSHNSGYGKEPNILQKLLILINKINLKKYATKYFACSMMASEWMFGKRSSTIVHNAIDSFKFLYNQETRVIKRTELGIKDEKIILFVGRLDPQKNPLFLIEVFKEILKREKEWRLFIIGDGEMRTQVEEKILEYNLQSYVQLFGSRNDVGDFLQAADCFLLPSNFEGLGIVLIEAQAAGLKCFTSKGVVPSEVDVTGLVQFISLDKGAAAWADIIMQSDFSNRKNQFEKIKESGYDTNTSIKRLEEEYLFFKNK